MTAIRLVVDARDKLGEGALYDPVARGLWWVDIEGRAIQRFDEATGRHDRWIMPERVGCLALREGRDGLVVALESGFAFVDPTAGKVDWITRPDPDRKNRMNDGKCDPRGRFFGGGMTEGDGRNATLWRLDPDGSAHAVVTGVGISNSLCWSPDGRTAYFTDTSIGDIWAYDFDAAAGTFANRRILVPHGREKGHPDGSTVDGEGFLWNTRWDGWSIVRYAPDGSVDRIVDLPVRRPTCPSFGGDRLRTLYVTCAIWDSTSAELAKEPWAGGLVAFEPGVAGLPEPRFKG
jgi:L-arabinonolactonase